MAEYGRSILTTFLAGECAFSCGTATAPEGSEALSHSAIGSDSKAWL